MKFLKNLELLKFMKLLLVIDKFLLKIFQKKNETLHMYDIACENGEISIDDIPENMLTPKEFKNAFGEDFSLDHFPPDILN